MDILPPQTLPARTPTWRRHTPRAAHWAGGYRTYHACLRWDFGFTCAFCLLHEADLALQGTQGLGVSTAEHLVPQSVDERSANDYTNLVYACRFCNTARGDTSRVASGCHLLDPTKDAWTDHFQVEGDQLVPRDKDLDAAYTYKTYDLDDNRKIARRQFRRVLLAQHLQQVLQGQEIHQKILDKAEREIAPEKSLALLREARQIYDEVIYPGRLFLERYTAIPPDAPQRCRCRTTDMHCLPDEFLRQIVHVEVP